MKKVKSILTAVFLFTALAACGGGGGDPGPDPKKDNDGDGYTADVDCNDSNPDISPNATDIAGNGIDENCDGVDGTAGLKKYHHIFILTEQDIAYGSIHSNITDYVFDESGELVATHDLVDEVDSDDVNICDYDGSDGIYTTIYDSASASDKLYKITLDGISEPKVELKTTLEDGVYNCSVSSDEKYYVGKGDRDDDYLFAQDLSSTNAERNNDKIEFHFITGYARFNDTTWIVAVSDYAGANPRLGVVQLRNDAAEGLVFEGDPEYFGDDVISSCETEGRINNVVIVPDISYALASAGGEVLSVSLDPSSILTGSPVDPFIYPPEYDCAIAQSYEVPQTSEEEVLYSWTLSFIESGSKAIVGVGDGHNYLYSFDSSTGKLELIKQLSGIDFKHISFAPSENIGLVNDEYSKNIKVVKLDSNNNFETLDTISAKYNFNAEGGYFDANIVTVTAAE